jgi:hypothetical protein
MPRNPRSPDTTPRSSSKLDVAVTDCEIVHLIRGQHESTTKALMEFAFGNAGALEPRFVCGLVSSPRESGWKVW